MIRYSEAWLQEVERNWSAVAHVTMGLAREMYAQRRTFLRSPAYDTPTQVWSWLMESGVRPLHGRVFRGNGFWAGSGEVTL